MSLRSSADYFKLNCCILCPTRTQHLLIINPSHIRNVLRILSAVVVVGPLPRPSPIAPGPARARLAPIHPSIFPPFPFQKEPLIADAQQKGGGEEGTSKIARMSLSLSLPPRPLFSRGLFLGKKTRKRSISLRGRKDEGGRKTEEGTRRNIKKEWR